MPAMPSPSSGSATPENFFSTSTATKISPTIPPACFRRAGTRPVYYQTFTNVHLPLNTAAGRCRVLADLNFWDYGSQPSCSLAVRSFWQGKVTLQGRDWQVGIVQNVLNQTGSFENSQLLLRPWEKRNQTFNANGLAPDRLSLHAENLC